MYRDRSISVYETWDKAHNTYLEVWQGLGLIFGTALIGALGWIVRKCFAGAINRRRDETPALVAASVSVLMGAHALVDFSVQIEAIALTFMAILGAGAAQAASSRDVASD
jgi:O-antigen ligase